MLSISTMLTLKKLLFKCKYKDFKFRKRHNPQDINKLYLAKLE